MIRKILAALILLATAASAQQQVDEALPGTLTLSDVIARATSHHPSIANVDAMVEAQRHRVAPAKALPDPTLSVGWMGDPVPLKVQSMDPSSYRSIGVMQMFPLGGKRKLAGAVQEAEIPVLEAEREVMRRRILTEAKIAFFEYAYVGRALEVTARSRTVLEQLLEITESRYRVGKAMQADVLRAQLELSMLRERMTMLEQQREVAAAKLNTLMRRNARAALPPAQAIPPAKLPELSELIAAAQAGDPEIQRAVRQARRNELMVEMAKREITPDLTVGYMYQQRADMPDMHGMTFTVNLPIFYKQKQQERVKQAQLEVTSVQRNRDARALEVRGEIAQMYAMAESAERLMKLYQGAIMPQTRLTLESTRAGYTVGTADFLSVISVFTSLYSYETAYYRNLSDYQISLARMESMTGTDLIGSAKESQ